LAMGRHRDLTIGHQLTIAGLLLLGVSSGATYLGHFASPFGPVPTVPLILDVSGLWVLSLGLRLKKSCI